MIDAVKDYLTPKTFSILVYVCSILHFLCGGVFTGIVIALKAEEAGKFTCNVAPESTVSYKTQVDKACYSRYQQNYNSPLPFYIFVILSIWFPIFVAVIYSVAARNRVQEIDSRHERQIEGEAEEEGQNRTLYVFYFYFVHLFIRFLSGILFTMLQYAVFFPSGFDFEFGCSLPPRNAKNASASQSNSTPINCENSSATEKKIWWVIVSVVNAGFALTVLADMIRLCRRLCTVGSWRCDTEFITVYLLRKRYTVRLQRINLHECISYRKQVLEPSRTTDVIYGPKTGLDDLYINLVIHTERAQHEFYENMERHEIFDVYMQVPQHSIRLTEVKDLFYPEEDTNGNFPRKILAVGRPGIGKTVLTEKIMRDWANEVDKFYRDMKIAICLKFRWFNSNELGDMTLKTFLHYGTGQSDEEFERIYEDILKHPEKIILIFDGLDEFNGNIDCLDHLPPPNDPNICMSGISLFMKLISGHLLPGATVLVTSRPTANEFYSRFPFDRTVEIVGFTSDKIEEYVSKFCENHKRNDLNPIIWNHIRSSSDLLNLCYIPVNCFIVSTILFNCLSDPRSETGALPTTQTELYDAAVTYFDKYHHRKLNGPSSVKAMKKLQLYAYEGIVRGQLVFNDELIDTQMNRSGLLNCLSNSIFPIQTQYCFIHLTIQEFLAARYVIETFASEEIREFLTCNIESGKWHLVLQFIAGLLGKKLKMFERNYYEDCVLAFINLLTVGNGKLDLNSSVFVIKCLREADNENVVKNACETTAMNDVVSLIYAPPDNALNGFTSSDWAAVTFVCKHMKQLSALDLDLSHSSKECHLEVIKLLQQRCIKKLTLIVKGFGSSYLAVKHVFLTLMNSRCIQNHEHSKLTWLALQFCHITEQCLSTICEFFKSGHARCLQCLRLVSDEITACGVSKLCEVLDCELCPKLTLLDLRFNGILDEGVKVLCNALFEHNLFTLTQLYLSYCSLTDECIPSLCDLLTDERCNLTVLTLSGNKDVSNEGLRMLCESALRKEHCKLETLYLSGCSVTDQCIPDLRNALQDEHCVLKELRFSPKRFTQKGREDLLEIQTYKNCKARGLRIGFYTRNL